MQQQKQYSQDQLNQQMLNQQMQQQKQYSQDQLNQQMLNQQMQQQKQQGPTQDRASMLASQNPTQVGPKVQALGIPQAGARTPVGALGQGTARPPRPGQMINSTGLIGKQMQPR